MAQDYSMYFEEERSIINEKTDALYPKLPKYIRSYLTAHEARLQPKTRLSYTYDFLSFLTYLTECNPELKGKETQDVPISVLESMTPEDINEYMHWLSVRHRENTEKKRIRQSELSVSYLYRAFSSLSSLFGYLEKNDYLTRNVVRKAVRPAQPQKKPVVFLDEEEQSEILDKTVFGIEVSAHQEAYHSRQQERDTALIALILDTGIRVSECVGINLTDISLKDHAILIHRKENKIENVYMSDWMEGILKDYLSVRLAPTVKPQAGHENALFLSLQNRRISIRATEDLVRKYADALATGKHISVHKLRSSFATSFYRKTKDIYLLSSLLSHESVSTTARYAALEETRKKEVRNVSGHGEQEEVTH